MAILLSTLYERRLIGRRKQIEANLEARRKMIEDDLFRRLDTPYPPASRPGQSPRRRTGKLQRSTRVDLDLQSKTTRIGNVAPYAQYLVGTRPWVRTTLDENKSRYEAALRRGLPFGNGTV